MDKKSPFASKTIWANAIALLASLTGAFGLDLGLDPETQTSIVVGIMAVVNVLLRFMTSKPIGG